MKGDPPLLARFIDATPDLLTRGRVYTLVATCCRAATGVDPGPDEMLEWLKADHPARLNLVLEQAGLELRL